MDLLVLPDSCALEWQKVSADVKSLVVLVMNASLQGRLLLGLARCLV
jgi:hypothetical protein